MGLGPTSTVGFTDGVTYIPVTGGSPLPVAIAGYYISAETGWGVYNDTQYTSVSPLLLAADTDTPLPNNAGSVIETYKPTVLETFYSAGNIIGVTGMALAITVDFKVRPTSGAATYIEDWIDIGPPVGQLYRRISSFPKGTGEERNISHTEGVYTLDTWEANGGVVTIRSNGPCEIYDIRYVIILLHWPPAPVL